MFRMIMTASALALAVATPLAAQTATDTGTLSAADVGVPLRTGLSAPDYVKLAADSDMYEIAAGRIAGTKSRSPDVKSFARMIVSDHTTSSKTLKAALVTPDRKITPPSTTLSSDKQALVALLRKTPSKSFDAIFWQQQLQAHQEAWALHKGFATTGTDPALKQVAATTVPVIEKHIQMIKAQMPPANVPQ